ncbi:hypothetical protein DPMN_157257 [Dreissena polymorpha]|uniref:Uncharacterized protein n=1 Tax=Dreissena polymorpha TaxID=45954 RepID=A0A9D4EF38_DREPO|nr:hypothetical protein DPMN_157257 [Dreissena polymorpha]
MFALIPRGGLLGGDPAHTAPSVMNDVQAGTQAGAGNPVNVQGMDLAQQLQLIVRGELRRMMEVSTLFCK